MLHSLSYNTHYDTGIQENTSEDLFKGRQYNNTIQCIVVYMYRLGRQIATATEPHTQKLSPGKCHMQRIQPNPDLGTIHELFYSFYDLSRPQYLCNYKDGIIYKWVNASRMKIFSGSHNPTFGDFLRINSDDFEIGGLTMLRIL